MRELGEEVPSLQESEKDETPAAKARGEILRKPSYVPGRGLLEKIGNKAREIVRTVPPAERKPPTSGEAEIRSNKAGESGSEMEVEESKPQDKRPGIKPLSPAKAASGP